MRLLFLLLCLCTAIFGYSMESIAAISITIVDAPEKTLIYAPIQITAVIENIGNTTEAVSLADGWVIEIGQANEYLPYPEDYQLDIGEHFVAVLHPGERYYISKSLGPEFIKEGVFEVRVLIVGSGQCIPFRLSKSYSLEQIPSPEGTRPVYKCWSGKVYSKPVQIAVTTPAFLEDREVLQFVRSGQAYELIGTPGDFSRTHPTASDFSHAYGFLREKYPSSYYTFVAGLYAAAASLGGQPHLLLKQVLELQPKHPLRQYAIFKLAMDEIDRNLVLEENLESGLPSVMRQFIKQYKDENARIKKDKEQPGKNH